MIDSIKQGLGLRTPQQEHIGTVFSYSLPMNFLQVSASVLYSVHFFPFILYHHSISFVK